jgi:hypothetical protein
MINQNELAAAATDRIIDSLAAAILDDDAQFALDFDDLPELRTLLTTRAFLRLAAAIDACPYHCCDLEICDDDSNPCRDRLDADLTTTD